MKKLLGCTRNLICPLGLLLVVGESRTFDMPYIPKLGIREEMSMVCIVEITSHVSEWLMENYLLQEAQAAEQQEQQSHVRQLLLPADWI